MNIGTVIFLSILAVVILIAVIYRIVKSKVAKDRQEAAEFAKTEQEATNRANQAWLTKNNLPDATNRSFIEKYFQINGQYNVGIREIDWEDGVLTLSVQKDQKIVILDVDLANVKWIQDPNATRPSARFVYDEKFLNEVLSIGYFYESYSYLEEIIRHTTLESAFESAETVEITLTPQQYKTLDKSLI